MDQAETDLQTLLRQGLALHRAGQLEQAVAIYRKLLARAPAQVETLNLLAAVRLQQRDLEEFVRLSRQSLRSRPQQPSVAANLGVALQELKRYEEALAAQDRAIALEPWHRTAHYNRGSCLLALRRPIEALQSFERQLALDPAHLPSLINRGNALQELGRYEDALHSFDRVLALEPRHADALFNRGNLLRAMQRLAEAGQSYEALLGIDSDHVPALLNLGLTRSELGEHQAALQSFDRVIALDPQNADAWLGRGNALRGLRQPLDARHSYEQALSLRPEHAAVLNNLGVIQGELGEFEAAAVSLRRAATLDPQSAIACNSLGNALADLGDPMQALPWYERAAELAPAWVDPRWNKSLALLLLGRYAEGWALYEEGLGDRSKRGLARAARRWDGAAFPGRRLLIRAEQGLGDTLQFVRYARLCKQIGGHVAVGCAQPLQRLLRSASGVDEVLGSARAEDFDLNIEMMSLPHLFGTTRETIPAIVPYLAADAETRAKWAPHLLSDGRARVGLVWAGASRENHLRAQAIDRQRSLPLARLRPLLELEELRFYSLQLGAAAAQIDELGLGARIEDYTADIADYLDTAAIIEQLDLVISVDTSVAHAAGALGRPVWVLSRSNACWRWPRNHESSPWYPSARIFGQAAAGDWDPVITRVVEALRAAKLSG